MKKLYWIIAPLIAGIFFGVLYFVGIDLRFFLRFPGHYLFVIVTTFLLLLSAFNPKEMLLAFKAAFSGRERGDIEKGIAFFTAMQRYLILTGATGIFFFILSLGWEAHGIRYRSAQDISTAVVFYSLFFSLVLPAPFLAALKKKKAELPVDSGIEGDRGTRN